MSLAIYSRFAVLLEPAADIQRVIFVTAHAIRQSQDRINRTEEAMQKFDAALLRTRQGMLDARQLLERMPSA